MNNKVELTNEQMTVKNLVCKNKKDLIDSKEFFEVGVNGVVLKARVAGAGESAMKFTWFLGGISKTAKATPQTFFLNWEELPDGLVAQLKAFCGGTDEEEISDENITTLPVQTELPAK